MTKKKQVSFDAMVKFFMHNYKIPTKRDIEQINNRLDRIERMIIAMPQSPRASAKNNGVGASPVSATGTVLDLIKSRRSGISIAEILEITGYDDKKLRNIIFRLNKMAKITRISRGTYKSV